MLHSLLSSAAISLLFLTVPILYLVLENWLPVRGSQEQERVTAAKGQLASVNLPEGSKITLDAGSELTYPKQFKGNSREVTVAGEAFFEITRDSQKPFVVHAGHAVVKVLGTRFNVTAWDSKQEVRVAVEDGSVLLMGRNQNEDSSIVITKGTMVVFSANASKPSMPVAVDIGTQTAWMDRTLVLQGTPLSEAIDRLQRWYGVVIELPSDSYRTSRVTGTFNRMPVEKILEEIGLMVNLYVARDGDRFKLRKK